MSLSSTELPVSILFCRLCQSMYRQPRTLPCLHSFCHDCLLQLAPTKDNEGQATLTCPVCGQAAPLPAAGVSGLHSNDFLARMCQEYVGEVQRTLVSRGPLSPGAGSVRDRGPVSPTSLLASRASPGITVSSPPATGSTYRHGSMSPRQHTAFDYSFNTRSGTSGISSFTASSMGTPLHVQTQEHTLQTSFSPQRHSSSTSSSSSDVVQQACRRLSAESNLRGQPIQRRLSSTPRDVLRTWECLQHKLNSLQAAALQVTYSLDNVNMNETNWHQRKQDLRRDVQRRSAQLQFFVKRQERLLLAALDSRQTDEGFQAAADRARSELRDNLKSLMHETDVLRSVLDFATDSEILSLSSLLLGSPLSQTPVTMTTPQLRLVVPEDVSLEDMVEKDFGCLTSTLVTHTIFTPEEVDFNSLADDLQDDAFMYETPSPAESADVSESITTTTDNTENVEDSIAYIDEDSEEEEMIVEETFEMVDGKMQIVSKTVAAAKPKEKKEKLKTTTTTTTTTTETKDSTESRGRGRERLNLARTQAGTEKASLRTTTHLAHEKNVTTGQTSGETVDSTNQPGADDTLMTADKFQSIRESLRQRRRELLFPGSGLSGVHPHRAVTDIVGQERRVQSLDRTSAVRDQPRRSHSPAGSQTRVTATVIHTPVVYSVTSDTRRFSTNGSTTASEVKAEPMSPTSVSPTERTSRPVRRAISAASDKASKMEYLRENWRKRKEKLIQSEAFVTAPVVPAVGGDGEGEGEGSGDVPASNGDTEVSTTTAGGGKAGKTKRILRNKFSNLKKTLTKNGKPEEDKAAEKPGEVTEESKITDKDTGRMSSAITVMPHQQQAVEERVLQTVDSILQKRIPSAPPSDTHTSPSGPAQRPAPNAKTAVTDRPHAREPSPSMLIGSKLETLVEQEGKATHPPLRHTGLRVTSPPNTDISKERIQQVRANMRRKKERWRSLSLT